MRLQSVQTVRRVTFYLCSCGIHLLLECITLFFDEGGRVLDTPIIEIAEHMPQIVTGVLFPLVFVCFLPTQKNQAPAAFVEGLRADVSFLDKHFPVSFDFYTEISRTEATILSLILGCCFVCGGGVCSEKLAFFRTKPCPFCFGVRVFETIGQD